MRLVTWNCCRGSYDVNVPLLNQFNPDIVVVQECAKPAEETGQCIWVGDNLKQGVLIQSFGNYTITRLPTLLDVPKFVVPIQVSGPSDFVLFAVWSKGKQSYSYIEAVVRAVELYQHIFSSSECVLIGDLNSNAIWDKKHPAKLNHTSLVKLLNSHGMTSAYHHHYNELHGSETQSTYYFQWNEKKPFHIDYCFVPSAWVGQIQNVEICGYEDWKSHSDHRPLVVDISHHNKFSLNQDSLK